MGFEIFSRKIQWGGKPAVSFNMLGRMMFNKAATTILKNISAESLLLMWDKDSRLVGVVKSVEKDNRSYRLRYSGRDNSSGFSATTFMKHIGLNYSKTITLPARWEEKDSMFIIEIPEEYILQEQEPVPPESEKVETK